MSSPFELKLYPDDVSAAAAAAGDWLALLQQFPNLHTVALSGGRIAKHFFSAFASLAKASGGSLSNIHFFWADERCLDPSDPESNFRLARENLFLPLNIAAEKIHRLKGEWLPSAAVAEANQDILSFVSQDRAGVPVLDLIFLGLGEDGHIASLMPNAPTVVLESREPYAHVSNSPKPPPDRLTMTYPVLAAAKNVWMLATGAGKTEALKNSLLPGGSTSFARVLRSRERTIIYTDIPT